MIFKNKIRKSKNYTAVAVAIVALTSWGINDKPHNNHPDKKTQHDLSESSEAEDFTPVAYIIQLSADNATLASDYDDISRKNIYGICWRGNPEDNLRFSKQMGYSHVMYQSGMENSPLASDLYFLFQKPENMICPHLNVSSGITLNRTYPIEQQNIYREYFALKSLTAPFPDNLANGWFNFDKNKQPVNFALVQDWQQKRIVDLGVELTVAEARRVERPEKKFLFGGLAWDEPDLTGDFSNDSIAINRGANVAVTLAHWNGGDFSPICPGTTHEYPTHSDGKAAFYKKLKKSFHELYPERKLIYLWEPYKINGELLQQIYQRQDMEELLSNVMLVSEGDGNQLTVFADDASLFESGIIKRDWVGSTQPDEHRFDKIKEIVGKAGIHGSWFGWFGRFNEHGAVSPDLINHIYEIPNWHQLARVIPSWDNLCGVPINERSFVDGVYLSSNSSMGDKVLYSRQHKTNKLFVLFMDPSGTVPLKPGDKVLSVSRVDNFFIETTDASFELNITDNTISLATVSSRAANTNSFSVSTNMAQNYLSLKLAADQKEYLNSTMKSICTIFTSRFPPYAECTLLRLYSQSRDLHWIGNGYRNIRQ